jgi:ABC-2 type transport system ATP-binding protein
MVRILSGVYGSMAGMSQPHPPSGHGGDPGVPGRIVVEGLSKSFGSVHAVRNLTFTVEPGSVTGFLGPNGAGKTTTLRMLLGLVHPTSGTATIGGRPYGGIPNPTVVVGAALEAASFHPGRTARNHLRVYCAAAGLPDTRADQVLEMVGLAGAAKRKVRGFSLGMRQRLGLAGTLLGDPRVLILDEPANGLDPEGIRWLRGFFRQMAGEGRTVLVSSHLLNEIQEVADRVVILNQGELVRSGSIAELMAGTDTAVVRTPQPDELSSALARAGLRGERSDANTLRVHTADLAQVGHLAFTANVELHELSLEKFDLEQLFFSLTRGAYAAPNSAPPGSPPPGNQPGTPSGYQPGYQQPGYQQPGYQQPGYQQPGYQQPGYPPDNSPQPPARGGHQ